METYLKAGIYGAILAFALNFIIYLFNIGWFPPFLPAFIAVITIIVIFKMEQIKDALVVALLSYFFSDAFLGIFVYSLYFEQFTEPVQVIIKFSVISLVNLFLTPITAIVAAYLGTYFVKNRNITNIDLLNR